ncbi:Tripartite tricarboxylate transporter TctB family protein [Thalassobacillus cyri]|uniref:Tripartite tricarboxylate transporter TctB family protein n=1 Tax=Thalassobacillus cyri TaxID=571932 RepID=A0A1H4E245_9BACI|nr:tripartite tricarboxylate transporter TctB family protein [Thalassobacillus cyri]SEA78640.1 Tripartite tricarboxylate transporter TctB family protein [Thalassobacillus cyri]
MNDFLTLEFKFSESHTVFPKIVLSILVMLLILIVINQVIQRYKDGKLTDFNFKFFTGNYDKLKFYGTVALLIGYGLTLELLGFLLSSILFMFLIMLLYIGNLKRKAILLSLANSILTSFIIWFVFGQMFDITLP